MPERAVGVLRARTTSLMVEAREVPREKWRVDGEHNSDARRAFQIAAIAVAADSERYGALAKEIGLSERDIEKGKTPAPRFTGPGFVCFSGQAMRRSYRHGPLKTLTVLRTTSAEAR
jgi:hypothetical protein